MSRKHILIVSLVLSSLTLNNIAFAYLSTEWTSPFGNDDWCNPDNWSCMDDPHPITCVPDYDWLAFIPPITPGPNVTGGPCWWGNGSCCVGLYVHPWSWTSAPNSEMNIALTAGSFDCGYIIGICSIDELDSATEGHGIINLYSGTVLTSLASTDMDGLWIGGGSSGTGDCYGVLNIYGGLMTVPRIALYYGVVNLYGGTLEDTSNDPTDFFISDLHSMNKINIAGGALRLNGDLRAEIDASTRIIPFEDRGYLVVDYNTSTDYTTVTAISEPGIVWNPNPADKQTSVNRSPTLTWSPGDYVQDVNEHQVYFGTSFANVNDANVSNPLGVYQGVRDVNNYTPASPLDVNTTYYWRIDEVNDSNANSPWKGRVWRFTTTACEPGNGPIGDFTFDCVVDLYDVKVFSQEWLTEGEFADIYPEIPDGIVDFADFAIMAQNWLVKIY